METCLEGRLNSQRPGPSLSKCHRERSNTRSGRALDSCPRRELSRLFPRPVGPDGKNEIRAVGGNQRSVTPVRDEACRRADPRSYPSAVPNCCICLCSCHSFIQLCNTRGPGRDSARRPLIRSQGLKASSSPTSTRKSLCIVANSPKME